MNRYILFILIFFAGASTCHAEFVFTAGCSRAYTEVMNLNFVNARKILETEEKSNPRNFIPEYIESYIDFLTAFISEEENDFKNLKTKRAERLNRIEEENENSPYYLLVKAEMNLQEAVVKIKFEEYLTAAIEFRKAYRQLESNQEKFPDFVPNKKCLGILHALIGAVPSNFKWATNLLGFRGTIPQGLNELRDLLKISETDANYTHLYDETIIMLMFFEFHLLENNQSAMELAGKIEDKKLNQLHLFALVSIYLYSAQNEKCIELLSHRVKNKDEFPLHYLDFMLGMAKLNKLDMSAGPYFESYTQNYKGESFVKAAYQKLGWIGLLNGDTTAYFLNMKSAKEKSDDFTDEDIQALKEAEAGVIPNIYLLRARLLFDGGYYDRSVSEISGKPISCFPKFRDQLEFTYRLARIYDKQGKKDKAIANYEKTIKNGEDYRFYFAANSALYEGLIYENLSDTVNATRCYQKCLSMRNHEYQNSIDQKAESGLNRLNSKH
ncbi:MAG: hypothetical protein ACHQNT_12580 [Bacteroidia bacterium]